MPTRNIHLTPEQDKFVDAQVESGQYASASEVLRAGLKILEERQARFEVLKAAVLHGMNSGVAEGDVIGDLREYIRQRAAEKEQKTA